MVRIEDPDEMQPRSFVRLFLWICPLFLFSLACRAVTRMVLPDTPTPVPLTPTQTATPVPTIPAPTSTPIFEAACPSLLADILTDATQEVKDAEPLNSRRTADDDSEFRYLVNYTLKDDKLWKRNDIFIPDDFDKELDTRAAHERIWDYFVAIIPDQERNLVTEFSVLTDGKQHVLGGVSRSLDDPTKWGLRIDILDADDQYSLIYTLNHEFGHLLTLKSSQVALNKTLFYNPDNKDMYERAVSACPRYFTEDGCSTPGSYINEFFNRYWKTFYAEWQEIDKEKGKQSYFHSLHNFYKTYADQFLTDYAATSPEEDIAESWSFFVLAPKPEATSIANEKILFFYEYPELIQLRQEILIHLCDSFPQ